MTKNIITLNTAINCKKFDNAVYNSAGDLQTPATYTYSYSFDIPPIEVKNNSKLKVISIYEKGTSISTTTTTTINNTTSTTGTIVAGTPQTTTSSGTIAGTNTGIITTPNNIIYTFKIKDISYNSSYYYCNDANYPTIANLNIGYGSQYFNNHTLILNKQSINFINILVSDDIVNISKGILSNINFIITLEIEEE